MKRPLLILALSFLAVGCGDTMEVTVSDPVVVGKIPNAQVPAALEHLTALVGAQNPSEDEDTSDNVRVLVDFVKEVYEQPTRGIWVKTSLDRNGSSAIHISEVLIPEDHPLYPILLGGE